MKYLLSCAIGICAAKAAWTAWVQIDQQACALFLIALAALSCAMMNARDQ